MKNIKEELIEFFVVIAEIQTFHEPVFGEVVNGKNRGLHVIII